MARSTDSPLATLAKGALAGAVGTLAMDALWYFRYRQGGGAQTFTEWEFASGTGSYEDAGAPAQVGKMVLEGVFDAEVDPSSADAMTNIVHWGTGIGWGLLHSVLAATTGGNGPLMGLVTGPAAWGTAYGVLAPAGIYEPIWEYDAKTLWDDLSAHLVFGVATAAAYWLLSTRD